MSRWTYIAQRATTGEFLDWDVPIAIESVEWQLSGPGSLKGTLSPDVGGLRGDDGRLLLEEWGTLLYAEADGEIRWGGILVQSTFNGEVWNIEAAGFSTYPHARTFQGEIQTIGIDVADAFRAIWYDVQRFPDGNLGVQITGATSTGVLLGTPEVMEVVPPKILAAREILAQFNKGEGYPVYEDWTWPGCWWFVNDFNDALLDEYPGNSLDKDASTAWLEQWLKDHDSEITKHEDAAPYELLWYESPNCGDELDELTKAAPLDWIETHRWDSAKENIVHEVELVYPRRGRRRDDLSFVQGDNVSSVVTIESNGDDFANVVLGLGAGEGRAMLRRETAVRDGRLRREHVYADKAITDVVRLDALIADELNARKAALRVESLDVIDHPNAPIGSWQIGDDVLVRAELPWLGEIEVWVRITGWSLTGEGSASLSVVRSDLFRYGG